MEYLSLFALQVLFLQSSFPSVNKEVGRGAVSLLSFVKLASRAFHKYNTKSSGSTGNGCFTCETVGQTSTGKEERCNQSVSSGITGIMKNEYRKMVIYNGSSVYLRYSV